MAEHKDKGKGIRWFFALSGAAFILVSIFMISSSRIRLGAYAFFIGLSYMAVALIRIRWLLIVIYLFLSLSVLVARGVIPCGQISDYIEEHDWPNSVYRDFLNESGGNRPGKVVPYK